ncbi:uncharacterized protein LOC125086411 isoform X4 [Lutra lutra]|uniref:uncharacterized protein LOC125086411 isoform X4 n=1 Tax=Lutra lutra TaxID=9657 RepID=UPI001FD1162D|nr:uncharacterized protein LOC125086411 isoform X4 [Lutra lutra]
MPILPSSLTSGGRWRCNCKMTHAGCFYSPETNRVLAQLSRSGSFWGLTRGVLPNFQPLGPQFMGDFKPAKTERDDGTVGFRASSTIYSCKCIFLKLWICKHWGLLFKLHLESRGRDGVLPFGISVSLRPNRTALTHSLVSSTVCCLNDNVQSVTGWLSRWSV